jgi:hypothetical protein
MKKGIDILRQTKEFVNTTVLRFPNKIKLEKT